MFIADMHNDTLGLCLKDNRPFFSCYNASARYPHLQFAAAFAGPKNVSPSERRKRALAMAKIFAASEKDGILIKTKKDLAAFAQENGRALLLSVEGGAGTEETADVIDELYVLGLRVFGLAWDDNELAFSSRATATERDGGLTPLGVRTLKKLDALGIIPDVSHLSDGALGAVFEQRDGVVLATHSDLRSLTNHPRNLTDEQATEIARRGGVIGINLYPPFLKGETATMDDALRHTDALLSLVGEDAVGCGFDIDGVDQYPDGFSKTCSMHDCFLNALLAAYPRATVEKIMGMNVLRVLSAALPN